MSERASGKARKSPASKALAPKQPASTKAAAPKKTGAPAGKGRSAKPGRGKTSGKRISAESVSPLDPQALLSRVAHLESERERLLAALEKAEGRIRALEEGRDQVLNRIDWVIDSLRSLIETEQ
jgi:hypothetical protein